MASQEPLPGPVAAKRRCVFTEWGQAGSGLLELERADSECSLRAWGGRLVPDLQGVVFSAGELWSVSGICTLTPPKLLSWGAFPSPQGCRVGQIYGGILREGFDCLPSKVQTEAPRIPVLGEQSVQARRDLPASSLQGRRSPAESEDRCRQVLGWNQALGLLEAQEGGDGWNGPWQLSGSSQG